MRITPFHGWIVALALGAGACSGDDATGPNGEGDRGSMPSDDGWTSLADDGTRYYGTFPVFPGAGTSDEAKPLENGMICDSVPGDELLIPEPVRQCFFAVGDPDRTMPAATLEQVLECAEEGDTVHVRLTFHPWFVDNTYGENQVGWIDEAEAMAMDDMDRKRKRGKGHTFDNLVGSDHAEILLEDGDGRVVLQFKLDYVSEDPSAPSGYASQGVTGGEGEVIVGDASAVVGWMTSIDRNLNERGFGSYTTDSPETDELYTPNPDTPEWDYRVVYEAWIDADVFGDAGFGGALIEFVHASPSKAANNTIEVEPGECPPPPGCPDDDPDADCGGGGTGGNGGDPCEDNDPDTFCGEGGVGGGSGAGGGGASGSGGSGGDGGGPGDPCEDDDPDTVCDEGGSGGAGGDPQYCTDNPDDPECVVD